MIYSGHAPIGMSRDSSHATSRHRAVGAIAVT